MMIRGMISLGRCIEAVMGSVREQVGSQMPDAGIASRRLISDQFINHIILTFFLIAITSQVS